MMIPHCPLPRAPSCPAWKHSALRAWLIDVRYGRVVGGIALIALSLHLWLANRKLIGELERLKSERLSSNAAEPNSFGRLEKLTPKQIEKLGWQLVAIDSEFLIENDHPNQTLENLVRLENSKTLNFFKNSKILQIALKF